MAWLRSMGNGTPLPTGSVRHRHCFGGRVDRFRGVGVRRDAGPFDAPQQDARRTAPPGGRGEQPGVGERHGRVRRDRHQQCNGARCWTRLSVHGRVPSTWPNLNIAQRRSAATKLDAYPKRSSSHWWPASRDILPRAPALIDITDNEVSQRSVTQTDLAILQEEPVWPRGTQQTEVENFAADPRTPRKFFVFPPNNGSGQRARHLRRDSGWTHRFQR